MENRFSPLQLRSGHTLRNRVVVPPMASETATLTGFVTDVTVEHYRRLASSGAGLVWVEYSYVHPSGRSEEHQLGISSDEQIAGLARIARVIHDSGALAGIQLVHAGAKSERSLTGGSLQAPSAIAVPVKGREMDVPDPMTLHEIAMWKLSFFEAACRAHAAGFDLVEFHAAHGYGLNQWLSPVTNQRTDAYGGSTQGRARLLVEIVSEIRAAFTPSELGLAARIPGQDHLPDGLTSKEMGEVVGLLEAAGLDLIDVSSGLGGWRRPRDRDGEGYLVEDSATILGGTRLPVIGVGGIRTGAYIDEAIRTRKLSLAAVGRAILEDPAAWGAANLGINPESRCGSDLGLAQCSERAVG